MGVFHGDRGRRGIGGGNLRHGGEREQRELNTAMHAVDNLPLRVTFTMGTESIHDVRLK